MKVVLKISVCFLTITAVVSAFLVTHIAARVVETDRPELIVLDLENAIGLALRANRTLRGSANNLETQRLSLFSTASEFDVRIAPAASVGATQDTESVEAGVSLGKKFESGPSASVSPIIRRADDAYSGEVNLSLDVPLLRGFGKETNLNAVRGSEFSVRTAEKNLYLSKVNVVLSTVSSIYVIIEQRELVRLYASQVTGFKGHGEAARIKEKVGLATPMDIYRAEIRLKDAEDGLTRVRESLRNAKDRLKLVLAMPLEIPIDVSAPLDTEPITIDLDEAIEIALENRVELKRAEDEMQEAKRRSRVAKHNILPQLNVVMDYARSGFSEDFGAVVGFDEDLWRVKLVSTTDLARTSEKAAYQTSLINLKTARLNYQAEEDNIKRQVREKLEALTKAKKRITIRHQQIKQAEGKLALAQTKFNHGLASNFDVIEAETELQHARVNLVSVQKDYIVGTYEMRAALGTLIEH
jgi:outer membrane protein TolC